MSLSLSSPHIPPRAYPGAPVDHDYEAEAPVQTHMHHPTALLSWGH